MRAAVEPYWFQTYAGMRRFETYRDAYSAARGFGNPTIRFVDHVGNHHVVEHLDGQEAYWLNPPKRQRRGAA